MRSVHVLVLALCGLAVASAFNVPALVRRCTVACDSHARQPFCTLFPAPVRSWGGRHASNSSRKSPLQGSAFDPAASERQGGLSRA